jgi:hypothetical protein
VEDFIVSKGDEQANEVGLFDDEIYERIDENGDPRTNEGEQYISFLPHQIEIINRHYIKVCERIAESSPSDVGVTEAAQISAMIAQGQSNNVDHIKISRFVGRAFVSLRFQHFKQYLLEKYNDDKHFLRSNGNTVSMKLSPAKKPFDIYWNNMRISEDFRAKQLRNSYLVVTISLLISGIILFGLNYLQTTYKNVGAKKVTTLESIYLLSLPIWTFTINTTLNWGLYELNAYELHQSKTDELGSLILKNVTSKFFNTAFIYALVYFFGPKINFLSQNGLVYVIISLVVVNAALNLANQFIQPYYMYIDWTNKQVLEDLDKKDKINLFQIQLNKIVEKPAFPYDQAYSYYLQMIYISAFYGYLVPLIVPLTMIAFLFQYWLDKYNILKRFSSPVDLGYGLTETMWKALELTLLLRLLGHWIWSSYLHPIPTVVSLTCNALTSVLSLAYMVIVFVFPQVLKTMVEMFATEEIYSEAYDQVKHHFSKTYQS